MKVCNICKKENEVFRGKNNFLHVDHDHKTGKVRQLLYGKCNTVLGLVNDSSFILKEAIKYLELHKVSS